MPVGVELGSYYVSIAPSAQGIERSLATQVGPAAAAAGKQSEKAIAGGIASGAESGSAQAKKSIGGISKVALGLGAAFAASSLVKNAISGAEESRRVGAQTVAVIKSTGSAAGVTAAEVNDLAGAMSKKTGIDDETIQSGANVVLTFKNIENAAGEGSDILTQTMQVALDMSAALGQDLTSASLQVGKALNDPTVGMTALQRVGVTFTAQQKEQIKTMQKSGDLLGAQKLVLKELTSEFGGSAQAQATASKKLGVAFDNLGESLGTALLPVVDKLATGATVVVDVMQHLPGPVAAVGATAVGAAVGYTLFGGAIRSAATNVGVMVEALSAYTPNALLARGATAGLAEAQVAEAGASGAAAVATEGAAASTVGLSAALGPLGLAAAAAAVVIGLNQFSKTSRAAAYDADALAKQADVTGESVKTLFLKNLADVTGGKSGLSSELEKAGISSKELVQGLTGTGAQYTALTEKIRRAGLEGDKLSFSLSSALHGRGFQASSAGALTQVQELRGTFRGAKGDADALSEAQRALGLSTDGAAESMAGAAASSTPFTDLLNAQRDAAKQASDQLHEVSSAAKDALGIKLAVPEATDAQANAQADFKKALGDARNAGYRGDFLTGDDQTSRDLRAKYRDLERANADLVEAWHNAGVSGDELKGKVNALGTSFADTGNVYLGKKAIDDYTGSLWAMIQAMDQAQAKQDELKKKAMIDAWNAYHPDSHKNYDGSLTKYQGLPVTTLPNGDEVIIVNGQTQVVGKRAAGGPVQAGVPYVVNERGAEIFVPDQNGTILPHGVTPGGTNFNIYETANARATAQEVAALSAWKRSGRDGG